VVIHPAAPLQARRHALGKPGGWRRVFFVPWRSIAANVPTIEPEVARAGDTWKWTQVLADYPAVAKAGYCRTASAALSVLLDADVVVASGVVDYAVASRRTRPRLLPGTYRWAAFVTKAGERYTADEGVLVVERNLSTAAAGDALSHAEKALPIIEAALAGRLTADVEEYMINGKQVRKIGVPELKKLRKQYRNEIWRQRNGNKLGPQHQLTFGRAS
jgi:hypothetical protein